MSNKPISRTAALKASQRDLVIDRLDNALHSLYHAATPSWPREESPLEPFWQWFEWHRDAGFDYVGTDAVDPSSSIYGIHEYGPFIQLGRGGRTVAPTGWTSRNCLKSGQALGEDLNRAKLTDLIRLVEAFATYVREWNRAVADEYAYAVSEATATREDHVEAHAHD